MAARLEEYKDDMTNPSDGMEPGSPQVAGGAQGDPAGPPQMPPAPPYAGGQYFQPQAPQFGQQQYGQPQYGQQQFGPQQYPPYQGYPGYRQQAGTNGFAIAALICGIVFNVLGIIFGFVALNQIKRTGEQGRGMAIAGIWVGAASLVLTVVWVIVVLSLLHGAMQQFPTSP